MGCLIFREQAEQKQDYDNIYGVGQLCLGTLQDIAFLNKLGRPNSRSQFTGIGIVSAYIQMDSCLGFCVRE